ncbi:MAG: GTPase ObgE [Lachnospiraceae bacterium]|nr:GTPase ObgE [Lachnospiraceae bacterium]
MFADKARIHIVSGKGGDGCVSFRREKYVPAGGPDGGDGGKGGDIIFEVDKSMNTLFIYKHRYMFKAGNGEPGRGRRCHGKNGDDLILKVPEGTILREEHSGRIVADLSGENQRQIVLKGGQGGRGNMNFATATNQAPQYGQPGKPAMELDLTMELKLVADVGLVGFPNAGKSTFLKKVTNADPKIANYPFTTINPNLGVVNLDNGRGFVLADMPGLIEGAAEGVGLGHEFLRHIERTRMLIHVVDAAPIDGITDPVQEIYSIWNELEAFHPDIMKKPIVIAANKVDAAAGLDEDYVSKIRSEFEPKGYPVFAISAVSGEGVRELLYEVMKLLDTVAPEKVYYEQEFFPEEEIDTEDLPYTVVKETDHFGNLVYVVEGPKIEKMLSYTNLDSEKGFQFFQKFLKTSGIVDRLKEEGAVDGDTVRMYGHAFDYYEG